MFRFRSRVYPQSLDQLCHFVFTRQAGEVPTTKDYMIWAGCRPETAYMHLAAALKGGLLKPALESDRGPELRLTKQGEKRAINVGPSVVRRRNEPLRALKG